MSAGSLAKLTPVSVVELEDPQGGDPSAHGELQHQESGMERNYSYTNLTGVAASLFLERQCCFLTISVDFFAPSVCCVVIHRGWMFDANLGGTLSWRMWFVPAHIRTGRHIADTVLHATAGQHTSMRLRSGRWGDSRYFKDASAQPQSGCSVGAFGAWFGHAPSTRVLCGWRCFDRGAESGCSSAPLASRSNC